MEMLLVSNKIVANQLDIPASQNNNFTFGLTDINDEESLDALPGKVAADKVADNEVADFLLSYKHRNALLYQRLFNAGDKRLNRADFTPELAIAGSSSYRRVVEYKTLPALPFYLPELTFKTALLKRGFDVAFSISVMILGLPLYLLLMLVTRLTSKGPVFYEQERLGINQKPFIMRKFRTMYVNAEACGPQLSCKDDPRITPWGKILRTTRLDELPQFWNVLKGDMSVVGPRPERQFFVEKLIQVSPNYRKLLYIKPGITSIGQVHYGYAENVEQMCKRIRYDLLYLKNISFACDLKIIMKTMQVMIQRRGK